MLSLNPTACACTLHAVSCIDQHAQQQLQLLFTVQPIVAAIAQTANIAQNAARSCKEGSLAILQQAPQLWPTVENSEPSPQLQQLQICGPGEAKEVCTALSTSCSLVQVPTLQVKSFWTQARIVHWHAFGMSW